MMSATDVKAAAAVNASTAHDHECWLSEAARTGSDWEGLLALHLQILARCGLLDACAICDAAPCRTEFWKICREADPRKALGEQPRHIDRWCDHPTHIPRDWDTMSIDALWQRFQERRPTPATTIEAVMWTVRARGAAALKEPPLSNGFRAATLPPEPRSTDASRN